jgi:2-(3-amino-3-carboxypropyl)histidine synthase
MGQKRLKLALRLERMIGEKGKRAYLISANSITPETLVSFRKLDCLVNTACPRITIDDASRYKQPVLSPQELEIVLGEREWEDYRMDEF